MNEIERAIEYLEPISKHPTMTGAYCEHLKVAIEALCEQAERSKGCEYCGLIYKLDGAAYGTVDELIDNTFCPMCGKRLEEHHDAD